ncbi:hypothetical protein ACFSFZ_09840, partial [Mixta tenebrionis]
TIYVGAKKLIWGCCGISVILSGSMTGVALIVLLFLLSIFKLDKNKTKALTFYKKIVFYFISVVSFFVVFFLFDLDLGKYVRNADSVGLNNVSARISYLNDFLDKVSGNIFFPSFVNQNIYADNAFVYAWINIGFVGFVLYLFFSILVLYVSLFNKNQRKYSFFFLCMLLTSATTNVFNIWPVAYLFWLVAGYVFYKANDKEAF